MEYRTVLGIGDFVHDNGVAIVRDGRIIFAVNEERVSRKKLDQNIDVSLQKLESLSGIKLSEIDAVALAGVRPVAFAFLTAKEFIIESFMRMSLPEGLLVRLGKVTMKFLYVRKIKRLLREMGLSRKPFFFVNHHLTHAADAYYGSGFAEATVLTTDGFGDGLCATIYAGKNNRLTRLKKVFSLNSPGLFYTAVTSMLGFKPLQHEGKITGLAAFGKRGKCYDDVKKIISFDAKKCDFPIRLKYFRSVGIQAGIFELFKYLRVFALNLLSGRNSETPRTINEELEKMRNTWHSGELSRLLSGYSREDIAWSFQNRLEEIMTEFAEYAVNLTGMNSVAAAGGTFANVKVNQRIGEHKLVSRLFIYPHMGDGGTSAGAALYAYHKLTDFKNSVKAIDNVYLGPRYSEDEILETLNRYKDELRWEKLSDTAKKIASLVADKKIVGRYAGRMEYGPRALGNRSILVHPSDRTINDWLNKRLKRTEFMPFAPSTVAEESKGSYLMKEGCAEPAKFMTITFNCTQFMQDKCSAAVHIDGTARPQLVSAEQNSIYYDILKEFHRITGIPSFVNTSFNMHEEPIVCSPEDAVRAFLEGAVDALSLEDYLVYRK
ncbi:MAG: carbamoyltransferase C-terminal domain-containing protein [Elusimicrobiota bacterium]